MYKSATLEEFLAPISARLGRETVPETIEKLQVSALVPPHVTDGLTFSELLDRFCEEAVKVRVNVHRCKADEVAGIVASIVEEGEGDKVIFADDRRIDSMGIVEALQPVASSLVRWDGTKDRDECIAEADAANFGITFPLQAIAETGSIVQPCDTHCGRACSLLPKTHIAIIDASTMVSSMRDSLRSIEAAGGENGENLPSQIVFIDGPSATSDIELVRVEGVHGPMFEHYILFE